MTGVDVEPNRVETAAKKIEDAASGVDKGDPHGEVGAIKTAIPGSSSASGASGLATAWEKRFRTWKEDANTQGSELRASASTYEGTDTGARRKMSRWGQEAVID